MIYLLILFLLFVLAFNYDFLNKKAGKNLAYVFSCIILILLAGLRYRVGGDTLNYMLVYERLPSLFESNYFDKIGQERAEIGWLFLTGIAKLIGDDFLWLQILHAIIVNASIFIFIKRYSKHCFIGILFYFISFYFYFNFEILRESIAISFFLVFGLKYLLNKKHLHYILTVFVMMLFHQSAVILVFLPIINRFSLRNYNFFIICTSIYLLGTLLSPLFYSALKSGNVLSQYSDKFDIYLEYNFTIIGKISSYILFVLFPLVVYEFTKKLNDQLKHFLIVYAIIGSITSLFAIFYRFINYITPILMLELVLLLTTILKNKKNRLRLEHSLFFILFVVLFNNYKYIGVIEETSKTRWYSRWYPYYSVFENKEDTEREYMWENKNFKN